MPSFGEPDDGENDYENSSPFSSGHPANRAARARASRPEAIADRKRRDAEALRNPDPLLRDLVTAGLVTDDEGRPLTSSDLGPEVYCICCHQRIPQ